MDEVIAYVKGPVTKKPSILGRLKGDPAKIFYFINPQFYYGNVENSARNFGVIDFEFSEDEQPDKEKLEAMVMQEVEKIIDSGIKVGGIIVPSHKIGKKIKYETNQNS